MKFGILLLLIGFTTILANGQTFANILNPSKETTKNAKINAQEYLNQVQDTLEIMLEQSKIKRLKLTPCEVIYAAMENAELFADASEFVANNNCEGIYRYQHPISTPKRTHYLITFYFDLAGELLTANSEWILIIR